LVIQVNEKIYKLYPFNKGYMTKKYKRVEK